MSRVNWLALHKARLTIEQTVTEAIPTPVDMPRKRGLEPPVPHQTLLPVTPPADRAASGGLRPEEEPTWIDLLLGELSVRTDVNGTLAWWRACGLLPTDIEATQLRYWHDVAVVHEGRLVGETETAPINLRDLGVAARPTPADVAARVKAKAK